MQSNTADLCLLPVAPHPQNVTAEDLRRMTSEAGYKKQPFV